VRQSTSEYYKTRGPHRAVGNPHAATPSSRRRDDGVRAVIHALERTYAEGARFFFGWLCFKAFFEGGGVPCVSV
jgi:hypothetical protein